MGLDMATLDESTGTEEVTTVFMMGFPMDVQEREVVNFMRFCPGMQDCSLSTTAKGARGYAKFDTQANALNAITTHHGLLFELGNEATKLHVELAKNNLRSGSSTGGPRKRGRFSMDDQGMPGTLPPMPDP